jgi:hypothetical protein
MMGFPANFAGVRQGRMMANSKAVTLVDLM